MRETQVSWKGVVTVQYMDEASEDTSEKMNWLSQIESLLLSGIVTVLHCQIKHFQADLCREHIGQPVGCSNQDCRYHVVRLRQITTSTKWILSGK